VLSQPFCIILFFFFFVQQQHGSLDYKMIYLKRNRGITKDEYTVSRQLSTFAPLPTPLEFFTQIHNQTMVSEKVDIFENESEFQNNAARFNVPATSPAPPPLNS
jgi:hypothetical protein